MSIDYDLTLAGSTPIEQVAERAFPASAERPSGIAPLLSADLNNRYGFVATVVGGQRGYVDVLADGGSWTWEPETYRQVGFSLDDDADRHWAIINMLTVVRQVLITGNEDAVLVLNSDILLLARVGGQVTMHHQPDWWTRYAGASDVLQGLITSGGTPEPGS
jgi:hypothetical protein